MKQPPHIDSPNAPTSDAPSPDKVRNKILLRRARFVAAALASAGVAAVQANACSPCLSTRNPNDPQDVDASGAVTVEAVPPASVSAFPSAEPADAGGATTISAPPDAEVPVPCLSVSVVDPPPRPVDAGPRPCLSPRRPRDAGTTPTVCLSRPLGRPDAGRPEPVMCLSPFNIDDFDQPKGGR